MKLSEIRRDQIIRGLAAVGFVTIIAGILWTIAYVSKQFAGCAV